MWEVDNRTPYSADRNWTREKDGAHHWIVAVKASFRVTPRGELELAEEQSPPLLEPEYVGDPGESSLRFDTDLGPLKPATDVWVCGHARAPRDKPVTELPISLRFGKIEKTLLVRGENVYYSGAGGLTTTSPRPFVRMPVVYERAFGGFDTTSADPSRHRLYARNPVGVGFAASSRPREHEPGPNVVYPGKDPAQSGPAGFGAIAAHWSPRVELAGTYDAAWVKTRRPLLPADYDDRFSLCSPEDQRPLSYVAPGTTVQLVHMTANPVLRFDLPRKIMRFRTHFGARVEEHPGYLVSVILEPDDEIVRVVWQSSLRVRATQVDALDRTRVEEVAI